MSLFKEAFRFCEMTQRSFVKFAVANLSSRDKKEHFARAKWTERFAFKCLGI